MRALDASAGFTITLLSALPVLDTAPECEVIGLIQDLSGSSEISKVSFGTEAPHFQAAGIPTVVCGPGSVEQAHQANEFVAIDQIEKCAVFIRGLIDRMLPALSYFGVTFRVRVDRRWV